MQEPGQQKEQRLNRKGWLMFHVTPKAYFIITSLYPDFTNLGLHRFFLSASVISSRYVAFFLPAETSWFRHLRPYWDSFRTQWEWKKSYAKNNTRRTFWDEYTVYLYIYICPQSVSNQTKTHLWRSSLEELCTVRGMLLLLKGWSGGEKKGVWEERGWSTTICHRGRVW